MAPPTGEKMYKCTLCTCIFKRVASLNGHITKVHAEASKEGDNDIQSVMQQLRDLEKQTLPQNAPEKPVNPPNTSSLAREVESLPEIAANAPVADLNVARVASENVESVDVNLELSLVKLADSSVDGVVKHYDVLQRKVGDVRWYVCSYCGKEFKKPSDLIRHIRIHTRERPFKVGLVNFCIFIS